MTRRSSGGGERPASPPRRCGRGWRRPVPVRTILRFVRLLLGGPRGHRAPRRCRRLRFCSMWQAPGIRGSAVSVVAVLSNSGRRFRKGCRRARCPPVDPVGEKRGGCVPDVNCWIGRPGCGGCPSGAVIRGTAGRSRSRCRAVASRSGASRGRGPGRGAVRGALRTSVACRCGRPVDRVVHRAARRRCPREWVSPEGRESGGDRSSVPGLDAEDLRGLRSVRPR